MVGTKVGTKTGAKPGAKRSPKDPHREAVSVTIDGVARFLQEVLGQKLTGHIAGVSDPKTVGTWVAGTSKPRAESEERLRLAFQIVHLLQADESIHVVRAWFIGLNPQLNDEAPADVIREGRSKEALAAAKTFASGG